MLRVLLLALASWPVAAAPRVLIVADEFPAMEALAARIQDGAKVECDIVRQDAIPADIKSRPAVIVYIHRSISEPAELAFIDYAKSGGKLILLHHSISSGKRPNRFWFSFLGIQLPQGDVGAGGYKYYEDIGLDVVDLAPGHYITTHSMVYDRTIQYKGAARRGFALEETEVYLNHVFTRPKHVLFGIRYADAAGTVYKQDTGGWYERAARGWVFYFMAGHSVRDFENVSYSQAVVNALVWTPRE